MASGIYNIFKAGAMAGSFTLDKDTGSTYPVFVALMNNSYVFDADHKYAGQFLHTYEASGVVYVSGGHALSAPEVTQEDASDLGKWDGTDWELGAETITARFALLYSSTGVAADAESNLYTSDPCIACIDFGDDKTATAGAFKITWAAGGILQLTQVDIWQNF